MNNQRNIQGYDGEFYGVADKVQLHPKCEFAAKGDCYGRVVGTDGSDRVKIVIDDKPRQTYTCPVDKLRFVREH